MSEVKTYDYWLRCLNCGNSKLVKIPKGTTVKKWLEDNSNTKCEWCECDMRKLK